MRDRRIFWIATIALLAWHCSIATGLPPFPSFGGFGSAVPKVYPSARPFSIPYMPREVALMEYCLDNRQHLVCRQLFHTVREFSSKIKDKKLLDRVSQYDTEKKRHVSRLDKRQEHGGLSTIVATLRQFGEGNQEQQIFYRGRSFCPCNSIPDTSSTLTRARTTTVTVSGSAMPSCTYATPSSEEERPVGTSATSAKETCSKPVTVTTTVPKAPLSPEELMSTCSKVYGPMTCGVPGQSSTPLPAHTWHTVAPPMISLPTTSPSISTITGEIHPMTSDSSVSLSSQPGSDTVSLSSTSAILPSTGSISSDLPTGTSPAAPTDAVPSQNVPNGSASDTSATSPGTTSATPSIPSSPGSTPSSGTQTPNDSSLTSPGPNGAAPLTPSDDNASSSVPFSPGSSTNAGTQTPNSTSGSTGTAPSTPSDDSTGIPAPSSPGSMPNTSTQTPYDSPATSPGPTDSTPSTPSDNNADTSVSSSPGSSPDSGTQTPNGATPLTPTDNNVGTSGLSSPSSSASTGPQTSNQPTDATPLTNAGANSPAASPTGPSSPSVPSPTPNGNTPSSGSTGTQSLTSLGTSPGASPSSQNNTAGSSPSPSPTDSTEGQPSTPAGDIPNIYSPAISVASSQPVLAPSSPSSGSPSNETPLPGSPADTKPTTPADISQNTSPGSNGTPMSSKPEAAMSTSAFLSTTQTVPTQPATTKVHTWQHSTPCETSTLPVPETSSQSAPLLSTAPPSDSQSSVAASSSSSLSAGDGTVATPFAPVVSNSTPAGTSPSPSSSSGPATVASEDATSTDGLPPHRGFGVGISVGADFELTFHTNTNQVAQTAAVPPSLAPLSPVSTPSGSATETPASDSSASTPPATSDGSPSAPETSPVVPSETLTTPVNVESKTSRPVSPVAVTETAPQTVTTVVQMSSTTTLPPATITTTSPESTTTYCFQMPQGGPVTCLPANQIPKPTPPAQLDDKKEQEGEDEEQDDCETDDLGHIVYATDSNIEEHEKHWKDGNHEWRWEKQQDEENDYDEHQDEDEDDQDDDSGDDEQEWSPKKSSHSTGHKKKGKWSEKGSFGKKLKAWNKKKKISKLTK